jgi:hypothetical protein
MKRKHESRCTKDPKHMPYGTKGTNPYCYAHDQHMNYCISKKSERAKAKRAIDKERKLINK